MCHLINLQSLTTNPRKWYYSFKDKETKVLANMKPSHHPTGNKWGVRILAHVVQKQSTLSTWEIKHPSCRTSYSCYDYIETEELRTAPGKNLHTLWLHLFKNIVWKVIEKKHREIDRKNCFFVLYTYIYMYTCVCV